MYTSFFVFLSITFIMNFNFKRITLHVCFIFYFVLICIVQRIDMDFMSMR